MRTTVNYINGNYSVSSGLIQPYVRKMIALRTGENLLPEFPDSIDLKITNKCDINCQWCHENCNKKGKSFNLTKTIQILSQLPEVDLEVAIGGGNPLEVGEDLINLIEWLTERGNRARLTVNSLHLTEKVLELMYSSYKICLGISVNSLNEYKRISQLIKKYSLKNFISFKNSVVIHIIAGLIPIKEFEEIIKLSKLSGTFIDNNPNKFLILGYKSWGRGKNFKNPITKDWNSFIKRLIYETRTQTSNELIIAFDNLALNQLKIKESLLPSEWEYLYQGDDFTHSMYVDAVEGKFAPTSTSKERFDWDDLNIIDYFTLNRENEK